MENDILLNLVIKKVLSASMIYTEKNTWVKQFDRPRWAVIIKYEGETEYFCRGKFYVSNLHSMVILPMGCTYQWQCTQSGHFFRVEFESDMTCEDILNFQVANSEKILKIAHELAYIMTIRKPTFALESIQELYYLILKLVLSEEKRYLPSEKQQKIYPALDYIARNYDTKITNDRLAALTGLSTAYFRRLFAEVTGTSPIDYLNSLRIKKAKEMLKSDYSSITDIALSLGYSSIYDFSRAFKKYTGVSPTKY